MTVNHDLWYLGALLLATGLTTILLRAFPFICFGGGRREQPRFIRELGRLISPAAIAMLIVYLPFIMDMLMYTKEGAILGPVRRLLSG